ncbi:unnamed protein product, partial [Clonostachys chloroleuca]
ANSGSSVPTLATQSLSVSNIEVPEEGEAVRKASDGNDTSSTISTDSTTLAPSDSATAINTPTSGGSTDRDSVTSDFEDDGSSSDCSIDDQALKELQKRVGYPLASNIKDLQDLEDQAHVLDIGIGTGLWAIDIGAAHPDVTAEGVDIQEIQSINVPPNFGFWLWDIEDAAEWPESDFINCRRMTDSVKDWPSLLKRAHTSLRDKGRLYVKKSN